MKRAAVFFDRDNTLIANDGYLGDPAGVVLVDGAADAVARVRGMGFAAITFSNQSGVARGMFTEEAVHAVNARLDELLQDQDSHAIIGRHEFCPFHPDGTVEKYRIDSDLRKPKPGMILQAAKRLDLDLPKSWVIGNAPRDIEAGKAVGCRTILCVDPKFPASSAAAEPATVTPDYFVASLKAAVDIIVNETLGPLDVVIPPAPPPPVQASVKPQPETIVMATDTPPQDAIATSPKEPAMDDTAPPEPIETPASAKSAPQAETAPKPPTPKSGRSSPKITFAERGKSGTFVPGGKKANAKADVPKGADAESQPPAPAPRPVKSIAPVKAAARVRKPTFAERVRAGTFVPAGQESSEPAVNAIIEARPIIAYSPVETEMDPASAASAPSVDAAIASPPVSQTIETQPPASAVTLTPEVESKVESPSVAPTPLHDETKTETPVITPASSIAANEEPPTDAPTPPVETKVEPLVDAPTPPVEKTDEPPAARPSPPVETNSEPPAAASAPTVETKIESSSPAPPAAVEAKMEESPIVAQTSLVQTKIEPAAVKPASPVETKMKTTPPSDPQTPVAPPTAPSAATSNKKMTFAERVKAGTFQAERAAAGSVTPAATAPERPRRVMPMPGDKPQTQVNRVVESLTAVRPTEPITPEEQLEPILQSILEELRLTREGQPESDFSLAKLVAGIVQVLVLPALFFAYMKHDVPGETQSMLMLATYLQTLVIALLIMGRSK